MSDTLALVRVTGHAVSTPAGAAIVYTVDGGTRATRDRRIAELTATDTRPHRVIVPPAGDVAFLAYALSLEVDT